MIPTLRDVAEKAQVSVSTVSRVLNNKSSNIAISETTRQRVLQAAQEIGYRPNMAARHLVRQKSFSLVGVLVPATIDDVFNIPFYMTLIHGIAQSCQQRGYAVTIYFADTDDAATVEKSYAYILDIPTDGYILSTTHMDDLMLPRFMADHVQFVHIGHKPGEDRKTHFVDVDNYQGAYLAVTHLLHRGHRKIATIAAATTLYAGSERLRGYIDAMTEAGLPIASDWIVYSNFSEQGGYEQMNCLLDCSDVPTAVFAASDSIALGAARAIQDRGLCIPDDIAIVGFDDVPDALRMTPHLTTIRQPVLELGVTAAELLLSSLAGESPENVVLQPELIVRAST